MEKGNKKKIKRIIAAVCVVVVMLILVILPFVTKSDKNEDGPKASILSGTVEKGSVNTEVIAGGTLKSESAMTISISSEVKIIEYLVSNGTAVDEGQSIATVDKVTVMNAISEVQKTLDYLAKKIESESKKTTSDTVVALAGGTVKILYATENAPVQDIMLEHGALAVLSLDGLMAVEFTTESDLKAGTIVDVVLSDETIVDGKVESNINGTLIVTIKDNDYSVGQKVQIVKDDTEIGNGELYINSPWNITAYAGVIGQINVSEGITIDAGYTIAELSDVGETAEYRQLVNQRQSYEELQIELLSMYYTGVITAPCDGVVSGVSENNSQLLSVATFSETDVVTSMEYPTTGNTGGSWGTGGSFPQGGMTEQEYELYSLDKTDIASVTPQDNVTVNLEISEMDIPLLRIGMTAEVKMDALGGEKFTATITDISNTGVNNGGYSYFTVELTMERDEDMLAGMSATAVFTTSTADDILTVPVEALVEEKKQTVIYTGYDEDKEELINPVTVTLGTSDGQMVEIVDGLESGMTYYYAYYDTLEISFAPDFGGGFNGNLFGR